MRIDCQTHVFPPEYAEVLGRSEQGPQAVLEGDGCTITYGDMQKFVLKWETYGVERKLRDMDAAGVDVSVLSINMPGPENLVAELAVEAARVGNDALAAMVQQNPDRFVGLAGLPWQDVPAALAELERAVVELDMRGVMFYSHVEGEAVDAPAYDPLYRRIAELGVPVVLHPTVPRWGEEIKDYSMITMAGLMVHQSFAMLRLILGGVLERHPDLRVVHPHCGGVLPYLWGRVENQTEVMGRGRENITRPPREYYRQVYLDMVSPWAPALKLAYDFAGVDRLLFASDHPWVAIDTLVALVEEMDISAEDRVQIFGGNAQALFGIA